MTLTRRTQAILLISLLVLCSLAAGFLLGLAASRGIAKKKEDPAFWKRAALRHLDKLEPDAGQRQRFEAVTDRAVQDLSRLRRQALGEVWSIVERAMTELETDLTPEQRARWETIRPKRPAEDR